jgi:hypothetical protein
LPFFFVLNQPVNTVVAEWTPAASPADWGNYRLSWSLPIGVPASSRAQRTRRSRTTPRAKGGTERNAVSMISQVLSSLRVTRPAHPRGFPRAMTERLSPPIFSKAAPPFALPRRAKPGLYAAAKPSEWAELSPIAYAGGACVLRIEGVAPKRTVEAAPQPRYRMAETSAIRVVVHQRLSRGGAPVACPPPTALRRARMVGRCVV